jgi:TonB family protein
MAPAPPAKSHTSGLLVVIVLGVIFFLLLALLVFSTGKHSADQPQAQAETLTVLSPRIRLRTEPNAKSPVVATAVAGEKVILLDDHGTWARVQDPDGLVGWAERGSLERTAERTRRLIRVEAIKKLPALRGIANRRTTLYAGPGIFYPIVGDLPEQTEVKVYTRDHDFYAIDFANEIAYADIDSVDVTAMGAPQLDVRTSPPTTTAAPAPTGTTASAEPSPEATGTTEPVPSPMPQVKLPDGYPPAPMVPVSPAGVFAAVPPGGTQPEEIDRVSPRYPTAARAAGIGGRVVIRGVVRRDGTIDNVEIIKDLPFGLGESAREAVERWRFRPATWHGEPIDVYYTVTVNFRLQ